MIYVDSREKKNDHVIRYLEQNQIPYQIRKLSTGDYMNSENMTLTIDRKRNLEELSGNVCTSDGRFMREVRRGHEERLKMIVLVEHGGKIKTFSDVPKWHSKYSRVSGTRLFNELFRIHVAYGVEFLFCDKRSTGRKIVELLTDGNR